MSDLRDRLARLSPARLRALADAWGLPRTAGPPTAEEVATALEDPFVVKRRLARLTERQFDILHRLDQATYPVTGRRLAADLGLSFEALTPDLRALTKLFLIRRASIPHCPPDAAASPAEALAHRGSVAEASPPGEAGPALPEDRRSGNDPEDPPTRNARTSPSAADLPIEIRPRLRPIVHQVLERRRSVRAGSLGRRPGGTSLGVSSPRGASAGRSLLGKLARRGGRVPVEDLIGRLGPTVVRAEYLAGLADGRIDEAFDNGIWWLIARDPELDPAQTRPVRDEGTALLWDLLALADQIERSGLPLGGAEWTVRSDLRTRLVGAGHASPGATHASPLLRGSAVQPELRLQWLVRLSIGLGLAEPVGRALEATGRLAEWAELGFAGQAGRVVALWQDDLLWAEPTPPGRWGVILDRPRLRRRLLDHLRALRPNEWLDGADLARRVAAEPDAGLPARSTEVSPAQVQSLVRVMIELPLGWLGCLAFRAGERGEAVALTELGALALADPGPAAVSDEPTLVVQGDLEVICFESPPRVLTRILCAAELVEPGAISLHRLTREALWSALDRGETVPDLLAALAAHARYPVPDSVIAALQAWAAGYRAIDVRPLTLIEFDPPESLDALAPDSPLQAFLERRLGPGLAILRADSDFNTFQDQVRTAGFRLRRSRSARNLRRDDWSTT